jgi:hypothetical protein
LNYIHIHVQTYIRKERGREREGAREGEREREGGRERKLIGFHELRMFTLSL